MKKKAKSITIDQIKEDFEITKYEVYIKLLKKVESGEKLDRKEKSLLKNLESEFYNGKNGEKAEFKTQAAAAKYLGVARKQVSIHVTKGNIKPNVDGSFSRAELDRWAIEVGKRKDRGKIGKYAEDLAKWDSEFRRARAEKEKLLVDQLRGSLASKKEIEAEWAKRVEAVVSGLEILKDRLPPLLEGKSRREIGKILTDEIYQIRLAYATVGKYCPEVAKN